ncbi:MAG: hypothetical protein AAB505_03035, partial [Patescibacteria group bacterium]
PPTITEFPLELGTADQLQVKGYTYPQAVVILTSIDPAGAIHESEALADMTGNFLITLAPPLKEGVYNYSAIVRDTRGAESSPSATFATTVVARPWLRFGSELVAWLSVLVPLLALLLLVLIVVWYAWHKVRQLKKKLRRESRQAAEALHRAFDFMRSRARDQLALLEAARHKRDLTKEEEILVKNLREGLDNVEQYVQKEIGDIERMAE